MALVGDGRLILNLLNSMGGSIGCPRFHGQGHQFLVSDLLRNDLPPQMMWVKRNVRVDDVDFLSRSLALLTPFCMDGSDGANQGRKVAVEHRTFISFAWI